ncbi:alpha/beta fold hydrolase [Actinoallomurus iriomotensis]|uniref:Esterase n=1 Tax=Actinoallomurus iriomotensis TaxID=478107 RepID=A0A9W6VPX1_9ACTN|nr:alpha/beta hydrolase [Actinoallomurus iriomotensis]GLY76130.1 esterase [Actinoallomurus iriomotensis]
MATYVLVPGFWLGGWVWETVGARLRAAGHEVHQVTLTGLGDRAHLATPEVGMETHTLDVVNTLRYGDLREVILVGHSGGGLPVAQAADRVPERLTRVVYLDSVPLPDGMRQFDANPPEEREAIEKRVAAEGEGWRLPPPPFADVAEDPVNLADLSAADLALLRERSVPQPFATATDPLRRTHGTPVPETLIACVFTEEQVRRMFEERHPMMAGFDGVPQVVPLPTGHYPMLSRPADTARALASLV